MFHLSSKLAAAGGLALLAFALVSANTDSTSPHALKRSTLAHSHDAHDLVARQRNRGGRFRGGGRGNPFLQGVGEAPKKTDGQLNPGNTNGQGQGTNDQQGTGQQNVNSTSGLPAVVVDTGDPQKNLFIDPSQVAKGLVNDGQAVPTAGQVASATSVNNFINSCLLRTDLPLTNGQQVIGGSCNAVPMGVIAAQNKAPSCKFTNPKNLDVIPPNQDFTITMAINNLQTGNFVNAQQNYFSAPQRPTARASSSASLFHSKACVSAVDVSLTAPSLRAGHSHVVVEQIDSLTSTAVTDPTKFAFFKGLNDPAVNGVLSAAVKGGLPEGVYKFHPINSASNHQPALVGVAQHGSLDDAVYFVASNDPNAVATALGLNAGAQNGGNGAGQQQQQGVGNAGSASSGGQQQQQQQQQQQGGGTGGNKRRSDFPHVDATSPYLLERRLAALLDEDEMVQ
ncbi:uncharacterized protein RHOBADRAFT_45427 [Rhodotorula graminis WP1]|uniref:Uncharacterized protein n=1 Tax=Rhodotorula graminis (strain WP1) TaxID=578459 RepID=A0A0P9EJ03_RHOGW|nr:uncharacterized protein RHOBADRAFT_45427 [Rhodotorula graminis WP1]KPV73464.1 hypothetical protein RHOBADRAFT_45427 [Rhodotorula graminis WP1]